MKRLQLVCSLGLLISMFGCRSNHNQIHVVEVKDVSVTPVSATVLVDSISPDPAQIGYYDNHLLIRDTYVPEGEGQLIFYDLKTGSRTSCIHKGRGPGETIGFYDFFVMEPQKELYLIDVTARKILHAPVEDLMGGSVSLRDIASIDLSGFPNIFTITGGDGKLYATGMMEHDRFIKIGEEGGSETFGLYCPDIQQKELTRMLNQAYMGRVVYEPKHDVLVMACRYADQLEYYNPGSGEVFLAKGPMRFEPSYEIVDVRGQEVLAHNRDERRGYIDITTDGKDIYALYCGRLDGEPNDSAASEVRIFDWKGRLLRRLDLGEDVYSIALDDAGKKLYALSREGEVLLYDL